MLVDREKGRPLELDAITGVVVERCGRQGKEAPISALIQALLVNQLKDEDR
ncbi:MAG: ketopantoate reductase C-terminal domain-containing protein [Candidatus Thiodiazotropha taylori]